MEFIIKPEPGRSVWYISSSGKLGPPGKPRAALVADVLSDGTLNLTVFDDKGYAHTRLGVKLRQPDDPEIGMPHACWPPVVVMGERQLFERAHAQQLHARVGLARDTGAPVWAARGKPDGTPEIVHIDVRSGAIRPATPEEVNKHGLQAQVELLQLQNARRGLPQRLDPEGPSIIFEDLLPNPATAAH